VTQKERPNVTYPASSGHGVLSDSLVEDLTVSSCLHALHEDDLCGHERELEVQVSSDDSRPYLHLYRIEMW
jgi:hypothetical protein